jgi:hypothetical protein
LLWLMAHGPREVLFDVVGYHLLYRATWVDRPLSAREILRTLASWLNSTQALLLMLLAGVALTVPPSPSEWAEQRRREFRFCGWLVAGLALFLAAPLPTYPHYFILVVPFVSILAALGMNVLGARLWPSARPLYVVLPLLVLFTLGLAKVAVQLRWTFFAPRWAMVEELAREVNRVTPRDGLVHASEVVLFAARRLPPPGMENSFVSLLRLPPEQLARMAPSAAPYRQAGEPGSRRDRRSHTSRHEGTAPVRRAPLTVAALHPASVRPSFPASRTGRTQ